MYSIGSMFFCSLSAVSRSGSGSCSQFLYTIRCGQRVLSLHFRPLIFGVFLQDPKTILF